MSAYSIATRGLPQGVLATMDELLFAASEPGAWYDPSDMSTLFQDSAFTVPVTAVEQPVGGMLDLSGRGNHASMATTTKRPIYSRRVNRRSNSQSFTGLAAYLVTFANISITDLPGLDSGFSWMETAGYGDHRIEGFETSAGVRQRVTVLLKPQGGVTKVMVVEYGGDKSFFDLANLSASPFPGSTCTIKPMENGYFEITDERVWAYNNRGGLILLTGSDVQIYTGDPSRGLHIAGVDVRAAADAHLPYQYVNTDTDYDADPAKFPAYLRFDGVDDAMQTGIINFTGTDKMTVWAGVSGGMAGTPGVILAHPNFGLSSFQLMNPGFTLGLARLSSAGLSAPFAVDAASPTGGGAVILSGQMDTNSQCVIRQNGIAAVAAGAGGGGYYQNAPLLIGANTDSDYFNGRLYSLIVRGAQSNLSQIEATEAYIKQKMRLP